MAFDTSAENLEHVICKSVSLSENMLIHYYWNVHGFTLLIWSNQNQRVCSVFHILQYLTMNFSQLTPDSLEYNSSVEHLKSSKLL